MKTTKPRTRRVLRSNHQNSNGHATPIRRGSLATARHCRPADAPAEPVDARKTILIVHPLQSMRQTVANTVRQFGYRVLEATSGMQAQSHIKAEPDIQLVIMEFPELEFGGLQTALWVAELNPQIKVLLASSRIWNMSLRPGDADQITLCPAPLNGIDLERMVRRTLE